jgi:4-oxalmesaconate hydratase
MTVIDVHGHVVAPQELYLYREFLIGSRGWYGRSSTALGKAYWREGVFPAELIKPHAEEHIRVLDEVGTDVQLISARPYSLMHSEKPARIVQWYAEANNNIISTICELFPNRFAGIVNLPQAYSESLEFTFPELDRCVNELTGFVGVLLNPDPSEGLTTDSPGLGDEYWFPLYEKLVAYDLPLIVHSTGCNMNRESLSLHFITEESRAVMSLVNGNVWSTFPNLKVVVPHGGGCIPYQMGRFRGVYWDNQEGSFDERVKRMWFDTSLYSEGALPLLFEAMGADNVVFGTERPGEGTHRKTDGGFWADDVKSQLEAMPGLSPEDLQKVLEGNARKLFTRLRV